jgi:aminoglycoside phosphotransferase (APT) family kinase protein
MTRASLVDEIATVSAVIRELGLGEVKSAVLKAAHHTTLSISPLMMVARVQSSEPLDVAFHTAVRELVVARHLAKQGAPVIAPLEEELAGPYVTASAVVTLWPYVEHERASDQADALLAAETLHAVHQAFYNYGGELPPYTQALDRCWSVLADVTASPALSEGDRDFLKTQYRRVRQDVEAMAGRPVPLHGDAHLGNLLLSDRGPVWTDFEDTCLGPPEQDIAGLPSTAWARFRDANQRLIERCTDLKSVCVAVWCWADISRSAEVREAAAYHLHRLRRQAL